MVRNVNLKSRWLSKEGMKSLREIIKILKKGKKVKHHIAPFGFIENLADYRCINFSLSAHIKKCIFENMHWGDAILINATIEKSVFTNIDFTNANLVSIRDRGNTFNKCNFKGVHFGGACLGIKGSEYNACVFESAKFPKTSFIRAEFNDCHFRNCRLDGADFNGSSFERCQFSGRLNDVWFRGDFPLKSDYKTFGKPRKNKMTGVFFAEACLEKMTFSDNCDLSSIILPKKGDYRLYDNWLQRLEYLNNKIIEWPEEEREEAEAFVYVYRVHAVKQDWQLINCNEVCNRDAPKAWRKIINTLDELS